MGLAATTWVPMGAQVSIISPNDHLNPSSFGKSRILNIFQVLVKKSLTTAILGLLGGGGPGYMGLADTTWVLKYPYCQQMVTQTHPRGDKRFLERDEFPKIFSRRMPAREG